MNHYKNDIIIVGGGFTALSILFNIKDNLTFKKNNVSITVINYSSEKIGRGNYIKNKFGNYYLNSDLNSVNLSIKNDIYNIYNWLSNSNKHEILDNTYLSRKSYGDYLEYCFSNLYEEFNFFKKIKLFIVKDKIININYKENLFILESDKNNYISNKVVLATGIGYSESLFHLNIDYSKLNQKKILVVGSSLSFLDVLRNLNNNNNVFFCSKDKLFPKIRSLKKYNFNFFIEELKNNEIITYDIINEIFKKYFLVGIIEYFKKNSNYCFSLESLMKDFNNNDIFSNLLCSINDSIDFLWSKFDFKLKRLIIRYYHYFSSFRNPMSNSAAEILIDAISNNKITYINDELKFVIDNVAHFKSCEKLNFDEILYTKGFSNISERDLYKNLLNNGLIRLNEFKLGVDINELFESKLCKNLFCIGNSTFGNFLHVNSVDILKRHTLKLSKNLISNYE